jgi:hypothetical protein
MRATEPGPRGMWTEVSLSMAEVGALCAFCDAPLIGARKPAGRLGQVAIPSSNRPAAWHGARRQAAASRAGASPRTPQRPHTNVGQGVLAEAHGAHKHLHADHLQHLIPIMVDHLHRDVLARRSGERSTRRVVEQRPGLFVDIRFQRSLQLLIRLIGACEVGTADEEVDRKSWTSCIETGLRLLRSPRPGRAGSASFG